MGPITMCVVTNLALMTTVVPWPVFSIEESNDEAKQLLLKRIAREGRLCEKRTSDLEMIANGKIGELLDPRESRK